ncbi:MAG TPA: glycosyltransferase [Nitrososphaeraceae archaeon]|nr:glycosyltransferase [Nitrososphaeraceae archaeon]
MKILYLTSFGLPNGRIEKSVLTATNNGYKVIFAGRESPQYKNSIFYRMYSITWNAKARFGIPYYWHMVRKQIIKIIEDARPDIIHAHTIFPAKMINDLGIPFIYDDNEHWAQYAKVLYEITNSKNSSRIGRWLTKQMKKRAISLWPTWEKEIVSNHPTITVSERIATDLKKMGNKNDVFVVPNFPLEAEIKNINTPKYNKEINSVYQGRDGISVDIYPHKNLEGLENIFLKNDIGNLIFIGWNEKNKEKIFFKGLLPRDAMFTEMSNYDIGLLPWKKHWSHPYLNPNKYAEYAHSGLLIINTSSLETISDSLKGKNETIDNYNDLITKISYYKEHTNDLYKKRIEIYNFAKKNLLWDIYEECILHAYQIC